MTTRTQTVQVGSRLTDAEALELYFDLSIHELGRRAFQRCQGLHPEPYRTYVVDRNINYSNVCTAGCAFCNFHRRPGQAGGYVLSYEEIGRKIEELLAIGGTQILMQGGLLPDEDHPSGHGRPLDWYLDLLQFIKKNYPTIHVHAFSPPEVWDLHRRSGLPLRDLLLRLQEAGLDTIPGGGAEILVDRVRRLISPRKTRTDEWLAVMREAHRIGMKTTCTMMFGHLETIPERIEHLRRLRDLQDETGGLLSFTLWPFQPEGTRLCRWKGVANDAAAEGRRPRITQEAGDESTGRQPAAAEEFGDRQLDWQPGLQPPKGPPGPARLGRHGLGGVASDAGQVPDGEHLCLADTHEYLKMLAIARLYLDDIPNVQSSWVTMGPKIGQLALFFGANDLGSVMMEENVVSAAGTTFRLTEAEIRHLIADAGWIPQQRDQYYRPVASHRTPGAAT